MRRVIRWSVPLIACLLPAFALAKGAPPAFTCAVGGKTTVGKRAAYELKLSPAVTALEQRIVSKCEVGDAPVVFAVKLAPRSVQRAVTPKNVTRFLVQVMGGTPEQIKEDPASVEVKKLTRKTAFNGLTWTFQNDGDPSYKGTPERKELRQALRELVPSLLTPAKGQRIYRVQTHDIGYGGPWGLAVVNTKTGEVRCVQNGIIP